MGSVPDIVPNICRINSGAESAKNMKVTKENLEQAILGVLNINIYLEKLQEVANKMGAPIETIEVNGKPYNEICQEAQLCYDKLDELLEGAKETIIDDLSPEQVRLLSQINRYTPNIIQKYYFMEDSAHRSYVMDRAKEIRPLYVKNRIPNLVNLKYREVILCYLYGRFIACCIISRAIIEMIMKIRCKNTLNQDDIDRMEFTELKDLCTKHSIINKKQLELADKIRRWGNRSIHSPEITDEKQALQAIYAIQEFINLNDSP